MGLVIDYTELTGSYAVDLLLAMDDIGIISCGLHRSLVPLGSVAYLEGDALGKAGDGEVMEVVDGERLLVGCLGVVAMGHIEDIVGDILLDYKPRTTTEAESLALTDGVEPQTLVATYAATSLQLDDISGIVAEITLDVIVVINLAEEAYALRILAAGIYKMFALGNGTHLVLHIMSDGKEGFLQLPVVDLGKEVGLVFHGVGTGGEPFFTVDNLGLGIMASGDEVVVVTTLLVECPKLDKTIAHDIGIRRESSLHLLHGISGDIIPILAVAIHHLQPASIAMGNGCSHLEVFLGRAVPLFLLLGTNLDIETVGMKSLARQFIDYNGTVNTSRQ